MWGKKDKSQFFSPKINIFLSITAFLGSYVIFCTWLIAATNSTTYETETINYREIMYSPTYVGKERQISIFFLNNWLTFSSPSFLLPLTRKLPFVRRPNSCIAVWQQLICWLVLLASLSLLTTYGMFLVCKQCGLCRYARDAVYVSSFALYSVSLLTLTAIMWTYFSLC